MSKREIKYSLTAENKTQKAFSQVRKSIGALPKVAAIAGAAVMASVVASYARSSKEIDKLAKSSKAIGIPTQELAALQAQAELSGVSVESLDSSMLRFTKRMGEAEQGFGAANTMLNHMGLSTDEFFNKNPSQQYEIVAQKIAGLSTAQEKAAAASAIFGREGIMMVNMLNEGAAGLAAAREEAQMFGLAVSEFDASKIEAANDSMTRVKSVFKGVTNQIAIQFAPVVSALGNMFIDATKSAGGVGPVVQKMANVSTKALGFIADMGRGLKVVFLGIRQAVAEVMNVWMKFIGALASVGGGIAEKLGFNAQGLKNIKAFSESFSSTTEMMRKELNNSMMEPMPSSKIKSYIDEFYKKMEIEVSKKQSEGGLKINPIPETKLQSAPKKVANTNTVAANDDGFNSEFEQLLKRYQTEEQYIAESYERRQEIINSAWERGLISEKKFHDLSLKNNKEYHTSVSDLAAAQASLAVNSLGSAFDAMAQAAKDAKGEQSKTYKAMFLASKAFAIAESIIKIQQGIANAAALPYPANIGAIASVVAATANIISTIQSVRMANFEGGGFTGKGIRAGGVDGKGGKMAVLHPNEKVTDMTKESTAPSINIHNYTGHPVKAMTRDDVVDIIVGEMSDSTSKTRRGLHTTSNVSARAG